jgi:hypothetical protein
MKINVKVEKVAILLLTQALVLTKLFASRSSKFASMLNHCTTFC